MKKNYLYKKIFGLLIVALLNVSCSGFLTAEGNPDPFLEANRRGGCLSSRALFAQIEKGVIPDNLDSSDQDSREVFTNYPAKAKVTARYVKKGGTGDGSSATNAAGDVKTVLDRIRDASENNVYMVLISPGTYDAGSVMSMKNNVAIIGQCPGALEGEEVIVLSGGKNHRVFESLFLSHTATLHGVTIAHGKADKGGGMWIQESWVRLNRVTFSENTATTWGGGLLISGKGEPLLTEVTFSKNVASEGGGMHNWSSTTLIGATFVGNTTVLGGGAGRQGGGLYTTGDNKIVISNALFSGNTANWSGGGAQVAFNSVAELNNVTFSRNTARWGGGLSTPIAYALITLNNVSFFNNSALDSYGGGMWISASTVVMNGATFTGNTAQCGGGGILIKGSEVKIANTVIWGNESTTDTVDGGDQVLVLTRESELACTGCDPNVSTGNFVRGAKQMEDRDVFMHSSIVLDITNSVNPGLLSFTYYDTRGVASEGAIPTSSAAVNKGLYIKKAVSSLQTIYYYSDDNTTWYHDPGLSIASGTPPSNAVDLTATDITGAPRVGRPDLGAFEAR